MSWIPKKNATAPAVALHQVPKAGSTAQMPSLEKQIVMNVRRLPTPVYATLTQLGAMRATIRSLVLMDRGTELEFELDLGDGTLVPVAARVAQRSSGMAGARFEYHIAFNGTPQPQLDRIARYVRELENRAAQVRSARKTIAAVPTTDGNRRSSYRANTDFPVFFRPSGSQVDWIEGRIGDISGTSVRINCELALEIGAQLELRFTLPSGILEAHAEETAAIDVSPRVTQLRTRVDLRRPFAEMFLRARVVTRFRPSREREVYGIAFIEADGYSREEIARYTHALQLSRLRG
jgi:hypothetical protein